MGYPWEPCHAPVLTGHPVAHGSPSSSSRPAPTAGASCRASRVTSEPMGHGPSRSKNAAPPIPARMAHAVARRRHHRPGGGSRSRKSHRTPQSPRRRPPRSSPRPPHPLIETDDRLVVDAAAEHLLSRGFRHFAFCGFPGANYSDVRSELFTARLHREGVPCHVYQPPRRLRSEASFKQEQQGLELEGDVGRWIRSLPKPLALLACNDIRGQQVLNVCRQHDIAVPEQVAVLGVDNDTVLCELSDPPLSSVIPDTDRIGFEAAALLDRLMRGKPRPLERPTSRHSVSPRADPPRCLPSATATSPPQSSLSGITPVPASLSPMWSRPCPSPAALSNADSMRTSVAHQRPKSSASKSSVPSSSSPSPTSRSKPSQSVAASRIRSISASSSKEDGHHPGRFRAKAR